MILLLNMLRSSHKLTSIRGFHTSAVALAAKAPPPKKKVAQAGYKKAPQVKSKKTSGIGKNFQSYVSAQKLENKAPELTTVDKFEGESIKENNVVKYNDLQMKKLIISGSFKDNQFRELFQTPITLVTKDTKYMESFVETAMNSDSSNNRICFMGENGIGKSTLLAQTQAMIANKGDAIILPIPYARQLVNGRNDYALDQQTKLYTQPMYLKSFISKIQDLNEKSLKKIKITKEVTIEVNTGHKSSAKINAQRHSLYDLVKLNAAPRSRGKQLDAIIHELTTQTTIPVFLTIDNFSALTQKGMTEYRDPENKPLHVERFQLGKLLFQFISGELKFSKGGVILSTSSDDRPSETLLGGLNYVKPDPYTPLHRFDRVLASRLSGVVPYEVSRFSKENVSSLCSKLVDAQVFKNSEFENQDLERVINQKYILSGGGNPGELIKSVVLFN